jgi:hypothetical protein
MQVISNAFEEYGLNAGLGEDPAEMSLKEKVHTIATEIGIETGW